jgi:hypothetical protein
MSNVLTHRFVSPQLDGPDTSQVQPSAWNEGHQFSGGTDGQMLVRATADATYGAAWATVPHPEIGKFIDSTLQPSPSIHHDIQWDIQGPTTVRISPASDGDVEITGVLPIAPTVLYEGQVLNLIFFANLPRKLTLYHYDSRSSAPARFFLPGGAPFSVHGLAACASLAYVAGNWWMTGFVNAPGALLLAAGEMPRPSGFETTP